VASDHHLLVGSCHLKLKNYHTSSQKTSHKYNIEMLKDEETKNWFKLTLSNTCKYQALASLQESKQHPREEESNTVVNQVSQRMKNAWREMCKEMLGRKSKQLKAYVSTDPLKKIEARQKEKDVLNHSRTRAKKADTLKPTQRLSKASEKTEGTLWMTLQDRQRKQ